MMFHYVVSEAERVCLVFFQTSQVPSDKNNFLLISIFDG